MSSYSEKDFLKELAAFSQEQQRLIEAEVDNFPTDPAASKQRREQAFDDFRFFCRTYFPHFLPTKHESVFQKYVFEELPKLVDDKKKGYKVAIAAPRGESKSTLITQLLNLWCVLTARKHFCVIIMDAFDQAAMMLEAIKAELEFNPRLLMDFPNEAGRGRVWQVGVIVTANNRKIQVAGSGKRIRGWRHGPYRPDLISPDDIENDENVRQKAQRDKTENWLQKAVLKLGPPDGTMDVFLVGTVLHYDATLNRTMKKATWIARLFKAIIKWPDRMDLWEKWEEILINDTEEAADKFYAKNRKKMDAGAVVSWPGVRPLELLMKIRADDHHAFDSEYQNDPGNDENAPFKNIQFWVQPCRFWIYFGVCDPSLGRKNKARDPSATLVGGYDREHGVLDVVEARISRLTPDMIINQIIQLNNEYHCQLWGIETVQFQEFLMQELVRQSAARGQHVPARGIQQHTDKDLRILSIQTYVQHSLIRLHRSQATLHEQLRYYPEADHDDGPDALEMLWRIASTGAGGLPKIATAGPRRGRDKYAGY